MTTAANGYHDNCDYENGINMPVGRSMQTQACFARDFSLVVKMLLLINKAQAHTFLHQLDTLEGGGRQVGLTWSLWKSNVSRNSTLHSHRVNLTFTNHRKALYASHRRSSDLQDEVTCCRRQCIEARSVDQSA